MGAHSSKSPVSRHNKSAYAYDHPVDYHGMGGNSTVHRLPNESKSKFQSGFDPNSGSNRSVPSKGDDGEIFGQVQEQKFLKEQHGTFTEMGKTASAYGNANEDEFYDGIPLLPNALLQKSKSRRSTQAAVAKVTEVSSRLGRAGSLGLGKAVEVLDALGSSMTGLNLNTGFASGATIKGEELQILAFEVANTIVKGSSLMQSLSKRSIRLLKEVVLPSEGVQQLVSKDMDELLTIVAIDTREELKIFLGEVVRFGNRCKASEWHNLDIYFEKRSRDINIHKQLKEEAELVRQQLMTLVQYTAELYHEMDALDRFELNYLRKCLDPAQKGDSLGLLKTELKGKRKIIRNLKKKSLWSRSFEEVMAKLVDIGAFLIQEMKETFGSCGDKLSEEPPANQQRLGPAGLALHYANVIMQIDTIVARSNSIPANLRDILYQSLPPKVKSSLCSKLRSFHVKEELTVLEIKAEMEKTLHWLVLIAINTAKAHHGFGWVGEWANTGSDMNRRTVNPTDVIQIETLHHANKEKTEAHILELLLWLNHLVALSKSNANGGEKESTIKSSINPPAQTTNQQPIEKKTFASKPLPHVEDHEMPLQEATVNSHELQESETMT